jgi:hypothetical protein
MAAMEFFNWAPWFAPGPINSIRPLDMIQNLKIDDLALSMKEGTTVRAMFCNRLLSHRDYIRPVLDRLDYFFDRNRHTAARINASCSAAALIVGDNVFV